MKNNWALFQAIALMLCFIIFFSSCKKDPAGNSDKIQQGNTTIEINAIYFDYYLLISYNDVINAPIHATVMVFQNGQTKEVPVNIPAGYKSLQEWGGNGEYLNIWKYNGYYDSTAINGLPVITGSVDSVKITAVSCSDKEYGFRIVKDGFTTFYHPKDPVTSVSFVSNKDTVLYSNYDFTSGIVFYHPTLNIYRFSLFNNLFYMDSDSQNYPIKEGMTIHIPVLTYFWNGRNYGFEPDGPQGNTNGSTLQLIIKKVTNTHFNATFSGKVWSSRNPDTLFISNGEIKNVLLPVIEQ